MRGWAAWALCLLGACKPSEPPTTVAPVSPIASAKAATPLPTEDLPNAATSIDDALAGDFACGPFDTKNLQKTETPLLEDRVRARVLPGSKAVGSPESGKLEVTSGDATMFFGARELFAGGDGQFERHATKMGRFDGKYEPVKIGKLPIIAGVISEKKPDGMVSVAHGWFLDPNKDVLDVAVFVSANAITDLPKCQRFAEKILSTVVQGPRMLKWGGGSTTTPVTYAKFSYTLRENWMMSSNMGIHDFARIMFRKRGSYPRASTELQMALDQYPGDWNSPGEETEKRKGNLLGLGIEWHLTHVDDKLFGAWTMSDTKLGADHAVASLFAGSAAERDEAIRFAESVKVTK